MASLKGWRSASTDEPVSAGELARLGATMASRGLALLLLCGGALPHRKLIRSSLRMVLRRFFTQANMSCKSDFIHQLAKFNFISKICLLFKTSVVQFLNVKQIRQGDVICPDKRELLCFTKGSREKGPPYYGVGGLFGCPDRSFSGGPPRSLRWWKTTQKQ